MGRDYKRRIWEDKVKTLLVALNSKYIHSNLAVWYLKACCGDRDVKVLEFTVNDEPARILTAIYREKPDITAFSCYIWNITLALRLAEDIRKVLPKTVIVLGGPEVSYNAAKIMKENECIDYIVMGEGEPVFPMIIDAVENRAGFKDINGIARRDETGIHVNPGYNTVNDLNSLPFPYDFEFLNSVRNRIAYYESSRGCPFSCSYCISSTIAGVRYLPLDRVKRELAILAEAGVKQVKFIDRTFNCNIKRAYSIIEYIISSFGQKDINFHFEAAGELFDGSLQELLGNAPPGLIQFEIGIQSTNRETLEKVNRSADFNLASKNIDALRRKGNIHIHLDLIAGLPRENLSAFKKSFNDVYRLQPHTLQLGFLKLLKGTGIRENAREYGYVFDSQPPYEVLYNECLSFDDIIELKAVERVLDSYYNSGRFAATLGFVASELCNDVFDFYRGLDTYIVSEGYDFKQADDRKMYTLLLEYASKTCGKDKAGVITELLRFDYLCCHRSGRLPDGLERKQSPFFREKCLKFLKNEDNVREHFPHYSGLSIRNILKWIGFTEFDYDVAAISIKASEKMQNGVFEDIPGSTSECIPLPFGNRKDTTIIFFDYGNIDPVTGRYGFVKISKLHV